MPGITRRALLPAPALLRSQEARRTNIVLILTDDHGAQLGCLGTPGLHTPSIDALAEQGTLFTRAYACTSSCAPSRCSILTGRYPHANGVWRNVRLGMIPVPEAVTDPVGVKPEIPTLPELLGQAGYRTGITAKFHLSPREKFPFTQQIALEQRPQAYFDAVKGFIKETGKDQPFFLMANTTFPHRPFRAHHFAHARPPVDAAAVRVPANLPDVPEVRADWADYLTSIQCADAITGAILDALARSGREEETLVLFAGDQGPAYVRGKATLYGLGTHVPLIARGPGFQANRRREELASLLDIAPTLLKAAGVTAPAELDGQALDGPLARPLLFAEHNAHGANELYPCRSAFDGRFRYIRNLKPDQAYPFIADARDSGERWDNRAFAATEAARESFPLQYELIGRTVKRPAEELYDTASDPYEMRDLAADPRFAAPKGRLAAALAEWQRSTRDVIPG